MPRHSKNPLSGRPKANSSYDVGYGRPPTGTRFPTGRSGNPKGRPKGAKNKTPRLVGEHLREIVLAEAYRSIKVNDGNRQVTVPMAQAIMRSLAVNAVKGHHRSQRLFAELVAGIEQADAAQKAEWLDTALEYKIQWERELARRERLGVSGPEPLPHPDHVVIDIRAGTAHIRGPATKEEKADWDLWAQHKRDFEQELTELEAMHKDPKCRKKRVVAEEIEKTRRVIQILEGAGIK